jgi:hypothetical protein
MNCSKNGASWQADETLALDPVADDGAEMKPTCEFYTPQSPWNYLTFARKRLQFLKKHRRQINHVMAHIPIKGFSFNSPLRICEVALVEKMRKEIPYSKHTWRKDILWRIVKDYRSQQRSPK